MSDLTQILSFVGGYVLGLALVLLIAWLSR